MYPAPPLISHVTRHRLARSARNGPRPRLPVGEGGGDRTVDGARSHAALARRPAQQVSGAADRARASRLRPATMAASRPAHHPQASTRSVMAHLRTVTSHGTLDEHGANA